MNLEKNEIQYLLWLLYKKWESKVDQIKKEYSKQDPNEDLLDCLNIEVSTIRSIIKSIS